MTRAKVKKSEVKPFELLDFRKMFSGHSHVIGKYIEDDLYHQQQYYCSV